MFWENANAVFDRMRSYFDAVPILLGLGLCRGCLGWVLETAKSSASAAGDPYLFFVGAGQFLGLILVLCAVRALLSWTVRAGLLLSISLGSLVGGAVLVFCCDAFSLDSPGIIAGVTVAGMGYSMLFTLWIELYGLFSAKKILLGFCLSYLTNLVVWLTMEGMDEVASFILCLLCAGASCVMLVAGYRKLQETGRPSAKGDSSSIPWALIAWLAVFSFAYSLADGVTGMGHTTISSKFGMAIPCIMALVGVCVFSKQFSSKLFFVGAFLLMIAGLGCTFFTSTPPWLSQLSMSAASESQQIMLVVFACQCGKRNRSSASFYYCLLQMTVVFSTRAALLPPFRSLDESQQAVLWAVIILLVAIDGVLLLATKFFSGYGWFEKTATLGKAPLAAFAESFGLTRRETTILYLLAEGRTYDEVAEELFIAQGTVRAHVGHIFEKTSVHSRWELEQKIREDSENGR